MSTMVGMGKCHETWTPELNSRPNEEQIRPDARKDEAHRVQKAGANLSPRPLASNQGFVLTENTARPGTNNSKAVARKSSHQSQAEVQARTVFP